MDSCKPSRASAVVTADEDVIAQVNILEKAFRGTITMAVNCELNLLRRNGVAGQELFKTLIRIYQQHNMREWLDRQSNLFNPFPINHPLPGSFRPGRR